MMEIEKLLHAAFSNGLSGPILFPHPSPKHCLIARTKTPGGRKAAPTRPPIRAQATLGAVHPAGYSLKLPVFFTLPFMALRP